MSAMKDVIVVDDTVGVSLGHAKAFGRRTLLVRDCNAP